jgi:hypothetical protein
MTNTQLSQARRALARLPEALPPLLDVLLDRKAMLKAYLDSNPRTCGNPSCRCARGEKHPAWVVRIPEGRTSRSRSVPEVVFARLEPLAGEYRRFRQTVIRWRRLMRAADQAIREIETARCLDPDVEIERDGK